MRNLDGRVVLSASDLMRFTGCTQATSPDLAYLRGDGPETLSDSEEGALLQKQGDEHESAYLSRLQGERRDVVVTDRGSLTDNAETTRTVLSDGPDLIFQAAFKSDSWGGWADFLQRVDRPSALDSFSYEVTDTKLKQRPHPKHALQLLLNSDPLTEIQDVESEFAYIEHGNAVRETLRLSSYAAYAGMTRERLEAFVAEPGRHARFPVPIAVSVDGSPIASASGPGMTASSTSRA